MLRIVYSRWHFCVIIHNYYIYLLNECINVFITGKSITKLSITCKIIANMCHKYQRIPSLVPKENKHTHTYFLLSSVSNYNGNSQSTNNIFFALIFLFHFLMFFYKLEIELFSKTKSTSTTIYFNLVYYQAIFPCHCHNYASKLSWNVSFNSLSAGGAAMKVLKFTDCIKLIRIICVRGNIINVFRMVSLGNSSIGVGHRFSSSHFVASHSVLLHRTMSVCVCVCCGIQLQPDTIEFRSYQRPLCSWRRSVVRRRRIRVVATTAAAAIEKNERERKRKKYTYEKNV